MWRLVDALGQVQTCELVDDTAVGAGWDARILLDGEPYFSRRCPTLEVAQYYAEAMKQENLRGGWLEPNE